MKEYRITRRKKNYICHQIRFLQRNLLKFFIMMEANSNRFALLISCDCVILLTMRAKQ